MCTNPLIIVYDKGGTVEVYGQSFKLNRSVLSPPPLRFYYFLNLQPTNVNTKIPRSGLARHVMGTIFLVIDSNRLRLES